MAPDARHALGPRRVPSGRGGVGPGSRAASHRVVSQGLARTQQRALDGQAPALQVDNTSFEEWMKMATDNKINASNTWSFALIDYFHDMSLLRSDSGDGSINFQKASCTLDGCVKVWTSRVDSVVVETGRLMSGLQDEDVADDEAPTHDADGDDEEDGERPKRRQKARETTLAKNYAQLQVKQFDLEFAVDPLFRKTSADFDEGGAGGLLMNHLHVDDHLKVVFDASDAVEGKEGPAEGEAEQVEGNEAPAEGEGEQAEEGTGEAERPASPSAPATPTTPTAPASPASPAPSTPTGAPDYSRLKALLLGAAASTNPGAPADDLGAVLADRVMAPSIASFRFAADDDTQLDMSLDEPEPEPPVEPAPDVDPLPEPELDFFAGEPADDPAGEPADDPGAAHEFDVALESAAPRNAQDMLFDYFDNRVKRNWAGPEHWKMSRVHRAKPQAADPDVPRVRRRREVPPIDFSEAGAVDPRVIFAPSTSRTGIKMPRTQIGASVHLLPEDQHYSSKRLMRLFLKPKAAIFLRRAAAQAEEPFSTALFDAPDPYDEELPALAPADDVFLEDGAGGEVDSDDEFLAGDSLRRVRPEYVEHAKKAKQVDVKRLKDNIWRGLDMEHADEREFGEVISGLAGSYPPARFSEISTSFCFICLLHLANEEGLEVRVPGGADAPVGQIDSLRVAHT